MNKLKLSINKELDVMVELGISAEEWFFIQLIFLYQEGDQDSLLRYFNEAKKDCVPKEMLISLEEKGILTYKLPKEKEFFNPGTIEFKKNFLKKYYKSSLEMGLEIIATFPKFIFGKGVTYPVNNITKLFRSLEDFCFAYGKAIKFSPEKHKETLEVLEWAKEAGMITFNIMEFVISHKWEDLEALRQSGTGGVQFDNSEML